MRFAEPVRALSDPAGALERLIAEGEVVLPDDDMDDEETEG
jgi:chromosome condensin MukBEF MukE localization factor